MAIPRGWRTSRPRLYRTFIGPQGLRSGWGALLFLLIVAALYGVVFLGVWLFVGKPKMPTGEIPVGLLLAREAISCVFVLLATLIMSRIERRRFGFYGLGGGGRWRLLLAGFAGGFICLSALVLGLDAAGYVSLTLALHQAGPAVFYALAWLTVFLLVGLNEETLFRGYLLATLARSLGFWPAALLMGLIFGAAHSTNGGETPVGIGQVVVAAITFTVLLRVTGSLWASIGFHAAWDWAQSYFYGTADSGLLMRGHLLAAHAMGPAVISGGSTGPEGSVLALPAFFAGGGLAIWLARRMAQPVAAAQPAE